jgi:RNA polymerase sigma-70 factor, ECF subfamily
VIAIPDTGADAKALERLCDQHAAALWRYAWRLTGDRGRAEDVVHETLLRAWQQPDVFSNGQSPRAWLFAVARSMITDERRGARLRPEVMSLDGSSLSEPMVPTAMMAGISGALNRALVGDAMEQLSAEHRAVVGLSYYRGRSIAQIAADLGIAEDAVKSRLHFALRDLHHALTEMGVMQ